MLIDEKMFRKLVSFPTEVTPILLFKEIIH